MPEQHDKVVKSCGYRYAEVIKSNGLHMSH